MTETHIGQQDAEAISQYDLSRKTDKTRWLIALAASLVLNGIVAISTRITQENIEKAKQTISFLMQEVGHKMSNALNAFNQNSGEEKAKTEQVNTWRNALKENPELPGFDYGDFFLKLSWLEGYISKEELEKDQQKLAELIKYYQELQKEPSEGLFSIIKKMIEEQFGEYTEWSAQLHPLLDEGKGNCDARIQMMISLIKGVFGNTIPMKVRVSRQKLENGKEQLHVDLLIEIYGKWHIVEPGIPETGITDLEGTAIFEVEDYVKTFLEGDKKKNESDIVKPEKTPNKNKLDDLETDALLNLAGNIDTEKLKTHGQRPPDKTYEETRSREPIEMTVIPRDSQAPATPDTDTELQKRQLTSQEVIDAALTRKIKISPDIESLEPLRGIPLDKILITNTPNKDKDNPLTGEWPSFEPLAKIPPKEIVIADKYGMQAPDLSPLYGRTTVYTVLIQTENFQEWEEILQNFTIQEAHLFIRGYRNHQSTLKPLTNAKITKSLKVRVIAREGTMDLTGIDSLAITPPNLNMGLFVEDQKFLNLQALGRAHFTTFEISDDTLDSGALDGVVIQADTVKFSTSSYNPLHRRYLKDTFRTHRVEILDHETEYSKTALEPMRGMPPLDFLSVEMAQHEDEGHLKAMGGHKSYHEDRTGEKQRLDLSPIEGTKIAEISICGGYDQVYTQSLGSARVTIVDSPADAEAVEKETTVSPTIMKWYRNR